MKFSSLSVVAIAPFLLLSVSSSPLQIENYFNNHFYSPEGQEVLKFSHGDIISGSHTKSSLPHLPLHDIDLDVTLKPLDSDGLFSLHKQLIQISSISGNERNISLLLGDYLTNMGLTVEYIQSGSRFNLYAYLGKTRDTKVMLTSHIDTVPPFIGYYLKEDEIHGRGSCDAKGSVVAQIVAFKQMVANKTIKEGDVSLLYVVDEEKGGTGMRDVDSIIEANWDTVIFGEPTTNKLAVGHKGVYYFELKTTGIAGHSGYPEYFVNANSHMIEFMYALINADWPTDELLGPTTVNIGLYKGGVADNVISPESTATVIMRISVEAEIIKDIVDNVISKISKKLGLKDSEFPLEFKLIGSADPTFLDYEVPGFETYIASYFTDIPNLTQRGFKRYLYGPGSILVAHGANEFVKVDDLINAVEGYKNLTIYALENN
ncbi:unnamed protein product [[Candida] boidinii]|nr:hydrolase activity protein [[Candida] boidinii]GMF14830.1 unnamed protein product [[Candida] boidinii]